MKRENLAESGGLLCSFDWSRGHLDLSGLICGVVGLICTLRESLSVHFFPLIGQFENIVGWSD